MYLVMGVSDPVHAICASNSLRLSSTFDYICAHSCMNAPFRPYVRTSARPYVHTSHFYVRFCSWNARHYWQNFTNSNSQYVLLHRQYVFSQPNYFWSFTSTWLVSAQCSISKNIFRIYWIILSEFTIKTPLSNLITVFLFLFWLILGVPLAK